MSSPGERDPARGWRFAERLLEEEDDERFEGLTEAQLRAALEAEFASEGITLKDAPNLDAFLARLDAKARARNAATASREASAQGAPRTAMSDAPDSSAGENRADKPDVK